VGKAGTNVSARSALRWHWGFVSVVMFSLVVTLATRNFGDTSLHALHAATVQSHSPQAPRQHMDSDAVDWAPPVSETMEDQVPTFYARVAPTGPPLPTLLIEENLYNRPPPSC